jgi:hypothetical protein
MMAEIAVERKRGLPWWAWLLIALAALLLAWALFDRRGTGEAQRQRAAGPVTDLTVFYALDNAAELVGRDVRIESANVLSVTGDRHFWVGDKEGRQVLVILNEVPTPNQPQIEGRYDVNPGQKISIVEGEVKRSPGWEEARSQWNIDPSLRSNYENQRVYIAASKLRIKTWSEGQEPDQTQPR